MPFKKTLFALVFLLTVLLLYPQIISNINETITPFQKEVKIVKLKSTPSMGSELFSSIKEEKRLDLFSNMERRNTIEEDNFFGLNKYLSRDGFTHNFPINRSLHLAASLSPLSLERGAKLRLSHENRLAIFNSEVTLGFTGDYSLRLGLTRHF